jgi:hypothetical protein
MNNDLNNILPTDANDDVAKQQGLHALNEDLFAEDDDIDLFEEEAKEGLQQLGENKSTYIIDKLNADLHRNLKKKKHKKRGIPDQTNVYITIVTILLLAIIAYMVVKKFIP